jgi:hypothetical protein
MPVRRPRSASNTSSSAIRAEALEVRVLPTVTATFSNGLLTLQGDQSANDIRIEESGGSLLITGNGGTQIQMNGEDQSSVLIAGVQNIRGTFGQGADVLKFENGLILNNVTLNLGGGGNDVEFRDSTINGKVTITGGNNADDVEFDASTVNQISLNLINGNDDVEFHGSTITGIVSINTGNGIDTVKADMGEGGVGNTFSGALTIKTGNQSDDIELRDSIFANLTVDAGADNDEIDLDTVTVNGRLSVNGGSGADEITLTGVTQTGTGLNSIVGLSGKDDVVLNGAVFASAVSINMGSGPMNELAIDDVEFKLAVSIFSNGPNDRLTIEQNEASTAATKFLGAVKIQMGPGSVIDLGVNHDSSYTEAAGPVSVKGTKPNLLINIVETKVAFTQLPVLKNAEFVIVPVV